jgi:hypothetical protein
MYICWVQEYVSQALGVNMYELSCVCCHVHMSAIQSNRMMQAAGASGEFFLLLWPSTISLQVVLAAVLICTWQLLLPAHATTLDLVLWLLLAMGVIASGSRVCL